MGRALILQNIGNGQYRVRRLYQGNAGQLVQNAEQRKSTLEAQAAEIEPQLDEQNQALTDLLEQIDLAIADENTELIRKLVSEATQAKAVRDATRALLSSIQLQIASVEFELADLQSLSNRVNNDDVTAWCVDYSTSLSGEVATIEVNGEPSTILIAPGGGVEPFGGKLLPIKLQPVAQFALNYVLHPGWQKWLPTYRVGEITDVDRNANRVNVQLDQAVSHYGSYPINLQNHLSSVPVQYMSCDAAAFNAGDRVAVRFTGQSASSPVVIGFASNPKPCLPLALRYNDDFHLIQLKFQSLDYELGGDRFHDYSGGHLYVLLRNNAGSFFLPINIGGTASIEAFSEYGNFALVPALDGIPIDIPWKWPYLGTRQLVRQVFPLSNFGFYSETVWIHDPSPSWDGTLFSSGEIFGAMKTLLPQHGEWAEIVIREPGKSVLDPSLEIVFTSSKVTAIDGVKSGFNNEQNRWEVWGYIDNPGASQLVGTYP